MATSNPRISVMLRPEVAAVMVRLSELTGNSQSALIGELLETSMPVFERMVKVLEAAVKVRAEATQEVHESLQAGQERLERQLGLVLEDFDEGTRPILEAAEAIGRRRVAKEKRSASDTRRRSRTPMSNRGVTPPPKGQKKS